MTTSDALRTPMTDRPTATDPAADLLARLELGDRAAEALESAVDH